MFCFGQKVKVKKGAIEIDKKPVAKIDRDGNNYDLYRITDSKNPDLELTVEYKVEKVVPTKISKPAIFSYYIIRNKKSFSRTPTFIYG